MKYEFNLGFISKKFDGFYDASLERSDGCEATGFDRENIHDSIRSLKRSIFREFGENHGFHMEIIGWCEQLLNIFNTIYSEKNETFLTLQVRRPYNGIFHDRPDIFFIRLDMGVRCGLTDLNLGNKKYSENIIPCIRDACMELYNTLGMRIFNEGSFPGSYTAGGDLV